MKPGCGARRAPGRTQGQISRVDRMRTVVLFAMMTRIALLALVAGCWSSSPRDSSDLGKPAPAIVEPAPDADAPLAMIGDAASTPAVVKKCIISRVLQASVTGTDTAVVADVGLARGVSKTWTASLHDPANSPGRLVRIDRNITTILFALPIATIQANPTVRLCP